jgi:hypothetical protein
MLLDLFEKLFDLSAAFVKGADGGRVERRVVGEKNRCFRGLRIAMGDAAQVLGVVLLGAVAVEPYVQIANDAARAIGGRGLNEPRRSSSAWNLMAA